ncbi:hypothetical protein [Streptomyces sp. NBRC 110611]|uniref:hypothetical protein n=1 Tax=Streptomyces sp. NBRC 110611 TaxID=1621259 RepID=UPI0008328B5D|nr:hypothetical protein [Streptomyces sp. NBRC 110611]
MVVGEHEALEGDVLQDGRRGHTEEPEERLGDLPFRSVLGLQDELVAGLSGFEVEGAGDDERISAVDGELRLRGEFADGGAVQEVNRVAEDEVLQPRALKADITGWLFSDRPNWTPVTVASSGSPSSSLKKQRERFGVSVAMIPVTQRWSGSGTIPVRVVPMVNQSERAAGFTAFLRVPSSPRLSGRPSGNCNSGVGGERVFNQSLSSPTVIAVTATTHSLLADGPRRARAGVSMWT